MPVPDAYSAYPDVPPPGAAGMTDAQVFGPTHPPGPDPYAAYPDAGMTDAQVFGPQAAGPVPMKTSQGLGFLQGALKPIDNAARGAEWLARKAGLPVDHIDRFGASLGMAPTLAAGNQDQQARVDRFAARGVRPGGIGQFAGGVVSTLPMIAEAPALVGGAAFGALNTDARDANGVALDAALGAAFGKAGDVGLTAAKRVVAPILSPAVKALKEAGVRMTPGQLVGGTLKRLEDGATSVPILGDMIRTAQGRGLEDFNRAAINRSLQPIGATLPAGKGAGYEAIDLAHTTLSRAYDAALKGVVAPTDATFNANLANLRRLGANLGGDYSKRLSGLLDDEISRRVSRAGTLTADALKSADSQLGTEAARAGKIQDLNAQDYAAAVRQAQAELRGLVARTNPRTAAAVRAVDSGYANLLRVEHAAASPGAEGGVFTPAQLDAASRALDTSLRKTQSARGGALMQDLATAGRSVLPSKVPDSGSPFRHILEATVAGLVAQEAHALPMLAKATALGATIGSAYTRTGQRIITPLLTARPAGATQAARLLERARPLAAPTGGAVPMLYRNRDAATPAR